MSFPGLDTFPGLSLFPSWTILLPPPGVVPTTVAERPRVPVTIVRAGAIPPRMIWMPRLFQDVDVELSLTTSLSPTMIVNAIAELSPDISVSIDAVGGAVQLTVPIDMQLDASAIASVISKAEMLMPTDAWVVQKIAGMSDNFNRADGSPGSNWLQRRFSGTTNAVIAGNAVQAGVPSTASGADNTNQTVLVFSPAIGVDNFATEATILSVPAAGYFSGVVTRSDASMMNFVAAFAAGNSDTAGIYTCINGTFTRRVAFATDAFQGNDTMIVEAVGNVYTVKRRRSGTVTTVTSWTDSANVMPSGSAYRHGGMYVLAVRSTFETKYGPKLDNWSTYAL